jgi:hypothetical protein
MPPRNPFSSNFSDAEDSETKEDEDKEDKEDEDEVEAEDTPVDDSKTVAEQMEMHIGRSNTAEVSKDNNKDNDDDNNNNNNNQNSTPKESNVILSLIDCATVDVLKLCHDGGVSLKFYDNLFATLQKCTSKNKVDVTKVPKHDTFLKSLRARISSPPPIISQASNLQVLHFDFLAQTRDLLGTFFFNNLNNLCVNMEPERRHHVFVATNDDKYVEMCTREWCQQTYAEFIKDPKNKQHVLPLMFYIDETGPDVFQRCPLEPLMFTLGILHSFLWGESSAWRHAGFIPNVEDKEFL